MKKIYILVLFILVLGVYVFAEPVRIVPGVTVERFSEYKGIKEIINVARIDLTRNDIRIGVGLGDNHKEYNGKPYGKESVSDIVEKNKALLGVNGDYFIMESFRDNLNFSMIGGEIISEPQYKRSVMFINSDNHIFFDVPNLEMSCYLTDGSSFNITGINRNRNSGDVILYTDKFASSTLNKYNAYDVVLCPVFCERPRPNSQITCQVEKILPNSKDNIIEPGKFIISTTCNACPLIQSLYIGDIVTLCFNMYAKESMDNTLYATGGGPMLVQNGCVTITANAESFKADITKGTAPRTAVGVNRNNSELVIVTVDGRSEDSKGMTLNTLAEFMKELDCYNAMNLDGGGSTTMSILGLVMNSPSEKAQRNVANALLVFSDYKGEKITPKKDYNGLIARGDSYYQFEDLGDCLWGSNVKVGYFDSHNVLHTSKNEAKGKIGYIYDGNLYDFNIEISNAPLNDIIFESLQLDTNEKGIKYHCKVKLIDKNNNLMPLSPIFIYANNGTVGKTKFISDEKGEINFDVLFYNENVSMKDSEESISFEGETEEPVKEKTEKSIRFVFDNFVKVIEF